MLADDFVQKLIHNTYAEEKVELLETLQIFNPYTEEFDEVDFDAVEESNEPQEAQLQAAIEKVLNYEYLDLGLGRSVIRTARRHKISTIAGHLLSKFDFFVPAINDVALYLHEVTDSNLAFNYGPPSRS